MVSSLDAYSGGLSVFVLILFLIKSLEPVQEKRPAICSKAAYINGLVAVGEGPGLMTNR